VRRWVVAQREAGRRWRIWFVFAPLFARAALLSGVAGATFAAVGAAGPAGTLAAANPNVTAIEYGL
jgi:hypothetical protein